MPEMITIDNPRYYEGRDAAAYVEDYLKKTYEKHFRGFDFFFDENHSHITILNIKWED